MISTLNKNIPIYSLAAFRIIFGCMMFLGMVRFISYGWVYKLYIEPTFFFTYSGFEWVKPLGNPGMYFIFVGMAVLALLIALGLFYRVATILFFLCFTYVELIDKSTYLNHYYFISLVSALICFLPLNRYASLDAKLNGKILSLTAPAWCLYALRLQLGIVYFFAGLAKINPDWLLKAEPLKTWLAANTHLPVIGPLMDEIWMAYAMSIAGLLFDITIPFFLLWKRSRPFAYIAVLVFHIFTWVLFPIGLFPWIMIVSTLVFFSPTWPLEIFKRFINNKTAPTTSMPTSPLILPFLACHFVLQLFLPLRHYLYSGNDFWSEEAYRFSWKVMLVEKTGIVEFIVKNPQTGKEWTVLPSQYIRPYQEKQMSVQPDMILSLARHIADDFNGRGHGPVGVYTTSFASLNGRPMQTFIDPQVDLTKIQDSLFTSRKWVLPLQKISE